MTKSKKKQTAHAPVYSFPPISEPDARVLILGTMPGMASLAAGEYYAHPQNAFWRIMGDLAGAGRDVPYARRIEIVKAKKIALWESLQCCVRPGSLDSSITQEVPSDFACFFKAHFDVRHVFFNGGTSEKFFKKHAMKNPEVLTIIGGRKISLTPLPSTSPAHAGRTYQQKLAIWKQILVQ